MKKKNKQELKWWYVVPVVLVIVVAGYAVIRFSEAGSSSGLSACKRSVANTKFGPLWTIVVSANKKEGMKGVRAAVSRNGNTLSTVSSDFRARANSTSVTTYASQLLKDRVSYSYVRSNGARASIVNKPASAIPVCK